MQIIKYWKFPVSFLIACRGGFNTINLSTEIDMPIIRKKNCFFIYNLRKNINQDVNFKNLNQHTFVFV